MFAYKACSLGLNIFSLVYFGLGLATINPVAASSLIGYGTPPDTEINFSIVDFHGISDDTIPYDEEHSLGIGPHDSVISWDGFYYDKKRTLLDEWAEKMGCEDEWQVYVTPYDGQSEFACFEKTCERGKSILRCTAEYGHDYPVPNSHYNIGAEVAYEFMKNHPRT